MRAVVADGSGGPEVLSVHELPDPEPGPGEVAIAVAATAVNRADLLQRQGFYPPPPGASDIIGLECSGTVAVVGEGVDGWSVGDEVCALLAGGGYASRVVVPAGQVMPRAGRPRPDHRGGDPRGRVHGVVQRLHGRRAQVGREPARARRGRRHRHLRHPARRVAGRPRADDRRDAREAGLLPRTWVPTSRSATTTRTSWRSCASRPPAPASTSSSTTWAPRTSGATSTRSPPKGGSSSSGCRAGSKGELDLATLLSKRAAVIATSLRGRPVEGKAAICASVVEHVWPLVADGSVRPIVARHDAPRRRRRGPPADGVGRAHRQDRAHRLNPAPGGGDTVPRHA